MHEIAMQKMSEEFFECWRAACMHVDRQVDGGISTWLRALPYPPFLEHFSFRLGNQLFFVRVIDVDGEVPGPGSIDGLLMVAEGTAGHACMMPMKRHRGGEWRADSPGWGLVDVRSGAPVDPVALVSDERIEMTHWELHDMAVQVVRAHLEEQGTKIATWQGNPAVDPAIWIEGASGAMEWIVVRVARHPAKAIERPANWDAIAASASRNGKVGHFAPVFLCSGEQPFYSEDEPAAPLWRGHRLLIRFEGLE